MSERIIRVCVFIAAIPPPVVLWILHAPERRRDHHGARFGHTLLWARIASNIAVAPVIDFCRHSRARCWPNGTPLPLNQKRAVNLAAAGYVPSWANSTQRSL